MQPRSNQINQVLSHAERLSQLFDVYENSVTDHMNAQ